MTKRGEAFEFFVAAFATEDRETCIIWPFATIISNAGLPSESRYGLIWIDGLMQLVHRVMCRCVQGKPPTPEHVAAHAPQICHNTLCCNPHHIAHATKSENRSHMHIDKTCTEAQQRILSKEQVQEIFYATGLQREIAERFGVCKQTVSKIKRREHLYAKKLPAVRKAAE